MIIGIDPGVSGGIAWLWKDGSFHAVEAMPAITETKTTGGTRTFVDPVGLRKLLSDAARHGDVSMVFIEHTWGRPNQANAFMQGYSFGVIVATVASLGWPYQFVSPQSWTKHFGLQRPPAKKVKGAKKVKRKPRDKGASVRKAQQLYPQAGITKVSEDGLAEALLIARFGATNGK